MMNGSPNPPSSGTQQVAAACSTPGSARMRSTPSRSACPTPAAVANRGPVSDVRIVSTLAASKPGSTRLRDNDVRISNAEPTSSTSASATSPATSTARVRFCRKPEPVRPPPSLRVAPRSARDPCSAGISPNSTPAPSETSSAKSITRQSAATRTPSAPIRGSPTVLTDSSARMPAMPRARPSAPPIVASTMLSVSSCRMMRARPAPRAVLSAISRLRPRARTSCRLATLAHAINRTKPTAPSSTRRRVRALWTSISRIGSAPKTAPSWMTSGNRSRYAAVERSSIDCACASETPGVQAAGDGEVVALVRGVRVELERRPDVGRGAEVPELEAVAHDPDDDVWLAAQRRGCGR